jgi:cell fate (sporulation/competence/biofilm development) regulator YlbF (YheA/YmcA/DUF963 family)
MNIYDKTYELARALKDSPETVEFRNASKIIEGNELNKKMLEDFRKIQIEAYTEKVQTGKMSKELTEKLQNLASVISLNPDVSAYLQAEQRFGVIWEDIMKILNEAVGIDLTFGMGK